MSKDRTQAIPAFIDLAAQQTHLGDSVETAISAVLKHGQFVLGPEVAELERQLAAFCGAKHCVSCANGTDALLLALMAEGVGKGDAVFVPAFTFVATVEVVVLCGRHAGLRRYSPRHVQHGCGEPRSRDRRGEETRTQAALRDPGRSLRPACGLQCRQRDRRGARHVRDRRRCPELRREPRWAQGRHACRLYGDELLSLQAARRLWRRRRRLHR